MILYGYSKEKFCLGHSWELKAEPRSCVTSQSSILIRFAIRTTLNIRRKRSKGLGGGGRDRRVSKNLAEGSGSACLLTCSCGLSSTPDSVDTCGLI